MLRAVGGYQVRGGDPIPGDEVDTEDLEQASVYEE
jgi:hypothetical protein